MARDIKLNSSEWCDMIFDGKNKNYGAYQLRKTSSKRHVTAFITAIIFVGAVAAIPSFLNAVKPKNEKGIGIDEVFKISELVTPKEEVTQQEIIKQEVVPPPPPKLATIQFTPPIITEDSKVSEEREMKNMEELVEKKDFAVSFIDQEGVNTKDAVAPEELREHQKIVEVIEPEKPYEHVEQMPQYPGGNTELMRFISSSIRYPAIAAESNIQGQVVIRFVVTKQGKVSDVKVLRTLDPSCDNEAVRVVKSMPQWIPGMQNGQPVAVYYTLPVRFKLQQ